MQRSWRWIASSPAILAALLSYSRADGANDAKRISNL